VLYVSEADVRALCITRPSMARHWPVDGYGPSWP
jgi:hypothetical protein